MDNSTRFVNLPPDVIFIIKNFLPLADLRNFRYVCVLNEYLYDNVFEIVTKDILKKDTLKVHLVHNNSKFLDDFNMLMNSKLNISLQLPSPLHLEQVENLKKKVIDFALFSHQRVKEITECDEFPIDKNTADILKQILPKMHQLTNIVLLTPITEEEEEDEEILKLLQRNSGLQQVTLVFVNFVIEPTISSSNIKELELYGCDGKISWLINVCAVNLTKLVLYNIYLDDEITAPLSKLQHLELENTGGEISSLINGAAPTLTQFYFADMNMDIFDVQVDKPFTNLKVLEIGEYNIDDEEQNSNSNLSYRLILTLRQIDLTDHPLLYGAGTLAQFMPALEEDSDSNDENNN